MLFAALELERDPLQWAEMPLALKTWVQHAGMVAAFGLFIYSLAYVIQRSFSVKAGAQAGTQGFELSGLGKMIALLTCLSLGSYVVLGGWAVFALSDSEERVGRLLEPVVVQAPPLFASLGDFLFLLGGLCAIIAVALPVLLSLPRLSLRRIGALARLSLKEAFRKRVVWAFSIMAVIFLFAGWFVDAKPEDQVRNYIRVIYWSLPPLFLLVACWLGAFSIPTDVKNQSIHTIVTKPVE